MGEELNRSLRMLAERGEERGALAVLEDARAEAATAQTAGRPSWQRGLVVAAGTAVGVLVIIAAAILLLRPFGTEELPPATTEAPVVPTTIAVTPLPSAESAGPLNDINDLALAPNGDLWAATAGGAVRWDVTSREFEIFTEGDGIPGRGVETIDIAPDGTVWIVGDQGIGRYDGSWQVFSAANTPELAGQLGALVVDLEGVVWATVASEPLARYDGTWTSVSAPVANSVIGPSDLAVDEEGTLWVGTHENGVFSFDGFEWRHFTQGDGAPERAWRIAVAPDGAVWAWDEGYYTGPELEEFVPGTGFARYDGSAWITYAADDGLLSNEGYVAVTGDGSVAVAHREWGPDHEEFLLGVSRFDGDGWKPDLDTTGESLGPIGVAAVGADGSVWMPSANGIRGFAGTETYELTVPEELATPPADSWTVVPDPEQAPIRVSTAIGDFEFVSVIPSPPRDIFYVAGTPYGAVVQAGDRLYWSEDYRTWNGTNLSREQQWLARDGSDLVGFGDGFTRYSWDGRGWVEGPTVDLPGEVQDIAFGPNSAVALIDSTVYYSADGVSFVPAEVGPGEVESTDRGLCPELNAAFAGDGIGPILVTKQGYVVLAQADGVWDKRSSRICEPLVWFSAHGAVWELRTPESSFGPEAAIWDVAAFDGRFVAIGSQGDVFADKVWGSDDGIEWQSADVPELEGPVLSVAGGELGWLLAGYKLEGTSSELSIDMWFSADGVTWDGPYPGPQGLFWAFFRDEPSAGSDAFVSVNGTHDGIVIGRLEE